MVYFRRVYLLGDVDSLSCDLMFTHLPVNSRSSGILCKRLGTFGYLFYNTHGAPLGSGADLALVFCTTPRISFGGGGGGGGGHFPPGAADHALAGKATVG